MFKYRVRLGIAVPLGIAILLGGCQGLEPLLPDPRAQGTTAQETSGRRGPRNEVPWSAKSETTPLRVDGTGQFVASPHRSASSSARGEDRNITLNLVNVPLAQAAKAVLADIAGVQYTIDAGVDGHVTLQTPSPLPKSAVLDLFETALRSNGAMIVTAAGGYRIVKADQGLLASSVSIADTARAKQTLGQGVHVVPLKYTSALEMQRLLEPISPKGSLIRADPTRNAITVSGSRPEITAVLENIATFDVDVMRGMSFALVPVSSSQTHSIAEELSKIFATDRDGPMAGMVRFLPNRRLNAILVISPQKQYLSRAETWIKRLDGRAENSERRLFTYVVKNRRAHELVEVLQSMFTREVQNRGSRAARNVAPRYLEAVAQTTTTATAPSGPPRAGTQLGSAGASQGNAVPIVTGSTPLASADLSTSATNADEPDRDVPRIKIVADDAKNTLLIEANQADYARVMRVIETLDIMSNQVLLEVTIAEVTLNDALKYGVRWYFKNKHLGGTFSDSVSGAVSAVFPGFSYAMTAANITLALTKLNEVTEVNVVSQPSLTVMDNKTAVLQIGDQVPITTQSAVAVGAQGAPIVNSVSYRDTGVILSLTPQVNESGRVTLDVEQEVSSVANTVTSGIDSPTIRQRRVKTTVTVGDGEYLALGGLIQKNKSLSQTKVPIVGDIPFIGKAFQSSNNKIDSTELVIFITPRVMRNATEARGISDELRREFETRVLRDRDRFLKIQKGIHRSLE